MPFIMNLFSKLLQRSSVVVPVLFALNVQFAAAQDLKSVLPTDPHIVKGKFANGLTYYIKPNAKPEKKVELRLVVNAGSILEDNEQQGLAHFMEHMNFNGTKNFQKNELVNYLQSIGVEFGADLNAYTSFDETVFILPIPTDKPGNLDKGFQIIEDWAHNALLTGKDIDDERKVVLEESRMGKGADQRMMQQYLPKLLGGSRYAERLPIGKDDILNNFKYDKIRSYYKDWYRPDLQAVIIVGDIDTATAMKYLREHFAGLKNPGNEKKRFYSDAGKRNKPEAMITTDKEATNYRLQIIFPSTKNHDEKTLGDYRYSIEEGLVTQMLNRRLADLARSANPPFPYAAASKDGWARDYESLMAYAGFDKSGPQKAMTALTAELARVRQYGFTENELELAKKGVYSNLEKLYKEANTTESDNYAGEYIRNFLEGEPIPGIENEYNYHKQLLPGIHVSELNKMVKDWVSGNNIFTLITGPDNKEVKLPSEAELVAMTQKGLQQEVKPIEEKQVASVLMDKIPTAGKVVSKAAEDEFGATTYTLSNGIKVTIKPTNYKSDEIIVKGVKKGGSNNYGLGDKFSVQYATSVVSTMGAGNFNPTDLEKVLAGKNVRAGVSIGNIENTVSGSSTVSDLESMFQLMYLKMMQPRKDEALFNAYREKQKSQIQFMLANPQSRFIDTTLNVLYQNNPLAPSQLARPEHYDAINLDRALEVYRNEFSYADGYQFFIVGNVKPEVALPLIETYLGSIPVSNKATTYKDNGVRPVAGVQKLQVKTGKAKQSIILTVYSGEIPYSEDLDLKAQAVAEILNIKVVEDLREKMGGIYSGGCFCNVTKEPYAHFSAGMQLPCGPENVDKLLAAANEEIKQIKEKGPDMKDLDKVKSQWHEQHRTNLESNGYWVGQLEQVLFWGKDKDHVFNYDKWIDGLKPADIQQTAQKIFDGKNEFTSILYPES
jgi:zinc protease